MWGKTCWMDKSRVLHVCMCNGKRRRSVRLEFFIFIILSFSQNKNKYRKERREREKSCVFSILKRNENIALKDLNTKVSSSVDK